MTALLRTFKPGQRIRYAGSSPVTYYDIAGHPFTAHPGMFADVLDEERAGHRTLFCYPKRADGTLYGVRVEYIESCTLFESVRGKPFLPGIDARRKEGTNPDGSGAPANPSAPARPAKPTSAPVVSTAAADVDALLGQLRDALTAPRPAAVDADAVRDIVDGMLAPAMSAVDVKLEEVADEVKDISATMGDMQHDITRVGDTLTDLRDGVVAPLVAKLEEVADALAVATPAVKSRVRKALGAASGSGVILDVLEQFYTPGEDAPANVLLCSPPSLGKSFAVRQFGSRYDVYLEHGCSDDMDEIATLIGGPVPDGHGGFAIVDGVMTQAVRAASQGQTVLLLLDEVLRLNNRAQEWTLSFLTGVKLADGTRAYRLRTRRMQPDGSLEVIECPAANLHIVAATNLGIIAPVEAFWSRWEAVRLQFTEAVVTSVASAILDAYGIADPDTKLATTWANIVNQSRRAVADGRLRFPVDMRVLERAAALATEPTAAAVATLAADRLADNVAHWNADTGDTDPESVAVCDEWKTLLRSLPEPHTPTPAETF